MIVNVGAVRSKRYYEIITCYLFLKYEEVDWD